MSKMCGHFLNGIQASQRWRCEHILSVRWHKMTLFHDFTENMGINSFANSDWWETSLNTVLTRVYHSFDTNFLTFRPFSMNFMEFSHVRIPGGVSRCTTMVRTVTLYPLPGYLPTVHCCYLAHCSSCPHSVQQPSPVHQASFGFNIKAIQPVCVVLMLINPDFTVLEVFDQEITDLLLNNPYAL